MVNIEDVHLKRYSEVASAKVDWLWYPYIAFNKLTLLQGDPGDGKSTMMLNLIASLSYGGYLPNGHKVGFSMKSIYQCSEDGINDTIKPRLEQFGANCDNIAFIDEESGGTLTLDDERLRSAIETFRPRLVVIDPIQAYIGSDADLFVTSRARKLMHRLAIWASVYECAIVLIGHFNKSEGAKNLYRGIGSIDVVAAARSVLQIEIDGDQPNMRTVRQVKNSLAGLGAPMQFEITPENGFRWLSFDASDVVPDDRKTVRVEKQSTKLEAVVKLLAERLKDGEVPANELLELMRGMSVGERTSREAKRELGIISTRRNKVWYWSLPSVQ